MAERFTNQINYVDLSAFGVGVNTAKNDNQANRHLVDIQAADGKIN